MIRVVQGRPADGMTFSPVGAGEKGSATAGAIGPGSNTGQKGGALIDYVTLIFSAHQIEEWRLTDTRHLLARLFGFRDEVVSTPLRNKSWQFYTQSAALVDREGEMVGKIGMGGNGDTVCVSLSGAGCRWVKSWDQVARVVEELRGRISRCDVAHDDYDGDRLDVHALRELAQLGEFAEGGRPPKHRFLSDEGHGTGCTLYVGGKGHKELCVYEKGKQLGDPSSPWVRAEVRLYGKHTAVPVDVLRNPADYLRGAYRVLAERIVGVCTRLKTTKAQVEATGRAVIDWFKRQCGPTVYLLTEVFGERFADYAREHIAREGHPARFKGVAKGAQLIELLRSELTCPASP